MWQITSSEKIIQVGRPKITSAFAGHRPPITIVVAYKPDYLIISLYDIQIRIWSRV